MGYQCRGKIKNGGRCKKRVSDGTYCYLHIDQIEADFQMDHRSRRSDKTDEKEEMDEDQKNRNRRRCIEEEQFQEDEEIETRKNREERKERKNREERKERKEKWIGEKPDECIVCYEKLNMRKPLSCGHWIHNNCILKSGKKECPICRAPLRIPGRVVDRRPPTPDFPNLQDMGLINNENGLEISFNNMLTLLLRTNDVYLSRSDNELQIFAFRR